MLIGIDVVVGLCVVMSTGLDIVSPVSVVNNAMNEVSSDVPWDIDVFMDEVNKVVPGELTVATKKDKYSISVTIVHCHVTVGNVNTTTF